MKVQYFLYKVVAFRYCTYNNIATVAPCFSLKISLTVNTIEPYPHTQIERRSVKK